MFLLFESSDFVLFWGLAPLFLSLECSSGLSQTSYKMAADLSFLLSSANTLYQPYQYGSHVFVFVSNMAAITSVEKRFNPAQITSNKRNKKNNTIPRQWSLFCVVPLYRRLSHCFCYYLYCFGLSSDCFQNGCQ